MLWGTFAMRTREMNGRSRPEVPDLAPPAAGWAHAEAAAADSVSLGGWFLHAGALRLHFEVARMEERLALRARLRFPHFHQVRNFEAQALHLHCVRCAASMLCLRNAWGVPSRCADKWHGNLWGASFPVCLLAS